MGRWAKGAGTLHTLHLDRAFKGGFSRLQPPPPPNIPQNPTSTWRQWLQAPNSTAGEPEMRCSASGATANGASIGLPEDGPVLHPMMRGTVP